MAGFCCLYHQLNKTLLFMTFPSLLQNAPVKSYLCWAVFLGEQCKIHCFSDKVLLNHNNWSCRTTGANKDTSVCLGQNSQSKSLFSIQITVLCYTVIHSNRGHYCVEHLCMNNLQWCFFPSNCMWFFVLMCMWKEVACLPVCIYTGTHRLLSDIAPQSFFLSPYSPLHCLCLWMRGLFGFSSGFPLFNVTLVLLSVSWPGHAAFFFFFYFSFAEEMISDWERWGWYDKLIYRSSELGLVAHNSKVPMLLPKFCFHYLLLWHRQSS